MVDRKTMKKNPKPPQKRRKRRSTTEIIDRILDAALIEFSEKGYSKATTAAIARRADVVEALIFSHFDSKANLFRQAIFKPLDNHFAAFMATHDKDIDESRYLTESRAYVSELVEFVRMHSDLFKSLIVNEAYATKEDSTAHMRGIQDYLDKMSAIEEVRLTQRPRVSPHLISRISFAAILACTTFDDWLFPVGIASEREIHEAICDVIMEGVNINHDV